MERNAVTGVGFDIDHTIAIDNKLERVAFLRLLELVAADGGHLLGSLADEIERIDALLVQQRGGNFSIDDAVRRFASDRGAPARNGFYVERFRTMALDMVDRFVIALPGANRTFEALRTRGVRTAVLSNGWNPLQLRKARCAGFEGPVLASADIGKRKPDACAFETLIETLGTAAENTWYVGDDPCADVEGARAAGLRAVWIDAEKKTFPPDLAPPPFTIHALEELADLVTSPSQIGMR